MGLGYDLDRQRAQTSSALIGCQAKLLRLARQQPQLHGLLPAPATVFIRHHLQCCPVPAAVSRPFPPRAAQSLLTLRRRPRLWMPLHLWPVPGRAPVASQSIRHRSMTPWEGAALVGTTSPTIRVHLPTYISTRASPPDRAEPMTTGLCHVVGGQSSIEVGNGVVGGLLIDLRACDRDIHPSRWQVCIALSDKPCPNVAVCILPGGNLASTPTLPQGINYMTIRRIDTPLCRLPSCLINASPSARRSNWHTCPTPA